jgi:hypothetical protein
MKWDGSVPSFQEAVVFTGFVGYIFDDEAKLFMPEFGGELVIHPGDWLVRLSTGEVVKVGAAAFSKLSAQPPSPKVDPAQVHRLSPRYCVLEQASRFPELDVVPDYFRVTVERFTAEGVLDETRSYRADENLLILTGSMEKLIGAIR